MFIKYNWEVLLKKQSPWELTICSFFGRMTIFSVAPLGFEHISQTLQRLLIRPFRLWKPLCSDYLDHNTQLSRPLITLWSNYPDSGRDSDQTVQNVDNSVRLWSGRGVCSVRNPSLSDRHWLGSRTSPWVLLTRWYLMSQGNFFNNAIHQYPKKNIPCKNISKAHCANWQILNTHCPFKTLKDFPADASRTD